VESERRPTGEQVLARVQTAHRPRLRLYIGAAPGVGKTYSMLDAHDARLYENPNLQRSNEMTFSSLSRGL